MVACQAGAQAGGVNAYSNKLVINRILNAHRMLPSNSLIVLHVAHVHSEYYIARSSCAW